MEATLSNCCVYLEGVTARDLYNTNLSYWGLDELNTFLSTGYKYWHYIGDYFTHDHDGVPVLTLEQLQDLKNGTQP